MRVKRWLGNEDGSVFDLTQLGHQHPSVNLGKVGDLNQVVV